MSSRYFQIGLDMRQCGSRFINERLVKSKTTQGKNEVDRFCLSMIIVNQKEQATRKRNKSSGNYSIQRDN